ADHIIDLGPGAGIKGGQVVAAGPVDSIRNHPQSITGRYLREPIQHRLDPRRPTNDKTTFMQIKGAYAHNLQNINVSIPLERLTVITGVSGSGKSSLAHEVLLNNLREQLADKPAASPGSAWQNCEEID